MLFACCWAAAAGRSLTQPDALVMGPIPSLAAGIPADVLARRPDVRAAELRLRKTLARGDEIRTGFYPTLSLTGGASTTSDTLTQVLQNPVGTLGATLALPFLEYNKTRLSIASADIDYQIAETEFRKQLYTALLEVEDGLAARQHGDQRLRYLEQQRAYAREAERLAGARFLAGATGVQPWLDEQNRCGMPSSPCWHSSRPSSTTWQASIGRWGEAIEPDPGRECGIAMDIQRRSIATHSAHKPIDNNFISSRMGAIISQEYAMSQPAPANRPRLLTVKHVQDVSPHLRRICLTSPELVDYPFSCGGAHVKIMLPDRISAR